MLKAIPYCLVLLLSPCNAAPIDEQTIETVSIRATNAVEGETPGVLHFDGDFMMRSDDWQLIADSATIQGHLDKPERVSLEGAPAHFQIRDAGDVGRGSIEAMAPFLEYFRASNTLVLSGGAVLKLDDEVIRSDYIEYNISTNRYSASGAAGVLMEVPPGD